MSGYHQCDGTETTATCGDGDLPERHCTFPSTGAEDITLDRLFQCSEHGSAAHGSDANLDCHSSLTACNDGNNHIANDCPHTLDQGAICFHEGESPTERRQCRACGTSTDRWHGCDADGCQTCQGNAFSQQGTVAGQHSQDIVFGCIQFASTQCTYNANENGGDFAHALRGFATCAGVNPQPAGYCHTSLISAEQLRNQDICVDGANSDIGFHIRIPFTVNSPGSYQFRMHADYGNGAFIGIDGAQHTPGNTWGHLLLTDSDCTDGRQNDRITLETGDHEFEALGFEDCCDGHAELEVHLPCDSESDSAWRAVTSGSHPACLSCDAGAHLDAQYKFQNNADDSGSSTNHGSLHQGDGTWDSPEYNSGQGGAVHEALAFDGGLRQYVTVRTPFSATDADFTIAVWLKPTAVGDGTWHGFVGHQQGDTRSPSMWVNHEATPGTAGLHWDTRTTCVGGSFNSDGSCGGDAAAAGTPERTTGVIPDFFAVNEWRHVVWTKAGTTLTWYKGMSSGGAGANPAVETADTAELPSTHVDLWDMYDIGRVDNYYTGDIDQVTFFNYALAAADAAHLHQGDDVSVWSGATAVTDDCKMHSSSAAQCGRTGEAVTCTNAAAQVRLSSYPQGRIEIFSPNMNSWGTVCGHWLWDNDNPADIVCRQLGYAGGKLYTYGAGGNAATGTCGGGTALASVFGYRVCDGTEANLWACAEHGSPDDRDCISGGCTADRGIDSECTHELDQGAICFNEGESPDDRVQCHTHNAAEQCDEWHGCVDGCQQCRGRAFAMVADTSQTIFFSCVSFETTQCSYSITDTNGEATYQHALREFALCSAVNPQPEGYCHASLASAMYLRNQDVCVAGANSDIGFHIRIPFIVNSGGMYHFRMHADYGRGTFIGIDGAERTGGNTWGHLLMTGGTAMTVGDHEFEALGFEDCCDGHAELEVHLPCDTSADPWRVVVSGQAECLRCDSVGNAVAQFRFSGDLADTSGTRHGTIQEGTSSYVADQAGVANEAFYFDGSTSIVVPTPFTAPDQDFTIEVMLKPTTWDAAFHGFVGYQADSTRSPSMWVCNPQGVDAGADDRSLHWDLRSDQSGANTRVSGVEAGFFALDTYVHVVWVREGQNLHFYKNGVLQADRPLGVPNVDLHALYNIGRVDNFFTGNIDQVGLYDYALGADEIARNTDTFFPAGGCAADTGSAGCCGETGSGDGVVCTSDMTQCTHELVSVGCFMDTSDRDLHADSYNIDGVDATLEVCNEYCYSRGYVYFAMQYGHECWCDNAFGHYNVDGSEVTAGTATPAPEADCNMACGGNPHQKCGSSWRNSVYEVEGRGPTLETDLLAWYCFDEQVDPTDETSTLSASARDCSGHGRDGTVIGGVSFTEGGGYVRGTGSGYNGMAASFDGSGSIVVPAFENFEWGSAMSVSVWINRGCRTQACAGADRTGCDGNYAGVVGNGYSSSSSWEIRMGRENDCTDIGGSVMTASDDGTWDHVGLMVSLAEWHHITMIYVSAHSKSTRAVSLSAPFRCPRPAADLPLARQATRALVSAMVCRPVVVLSELTAPFRP